MKNMKKKQIRPSSSTLGVRKPTNTLGNESRIGISTSTFLNARRYNNGNNGIYLGNSTIHRRRPRSGPLRSVLLDPRHAHSSTGSSSLSSRRSVSGRTRKVGNNNIIRNNYDNKHIESKEIGTSKSNRGHSYPREMLHPVHDVVDSGLRGRHHSYNHAMLREGMWRELEPLIALKILRGDSFEEYEDNVIQLQEKPGLLGGEAGIVSRIVIGFTSKHLIESLNFYTTTPFHIQSIEFRSSTKKSQMIEINTETQYVPNAAGMVKIFAPGMAQQIIVHIFRHKFVEERVDVGDEEDGGHIVNKKVKNLDDNASNNNKDVDSNNNNDNNNDDDAGNIINGNNDNNDDEIMNSNDDDDDDEINNSNDNISTSSNDVIDENLSTLKKVAFQEDIDDPDEMIRTEEEEEEDGRDVFIDEEEDMYDTEYGDLITMTAVGFSLHRAPTPAAVVPLLNVSAALRTLQRIGESVEADMLCGLALLRTRRFVQATEIFRRAELNLFDKNAGNAPVQTRARRAATFSLLAADGLSHVNQLYFKLVAFHRATQYCLMSDNDNPSTDNIHGGDVENTTAMYQTNMTSGPPIHPATDVKTGLLSLQPHLTHLLLSSLNDPMLPVREAAARGLQFVLDHIGCSVGDLFSLILQHLVRVYPVDVDQKQPKHLQRHLPEERAVLLLETCYGMLPYFSRHVLSEVIISVLEPHLIRIGELQILNSASTRLTIILLRVLILIIGRLRGDMPLRKGLIVALLTLSEHEISVVSRSARRCWEAVANNITYGVHRSPNEAGGILQWCAEEFSNINQARPRSARRGVSTLTLRMQDRILYLANATRIVATAVGSLSPSNQHNTYVSEVLMKLIPLLVTRIHKHCFSPEIVAASSFNQSDALNAFCTLWDCLVAVTRAVPGDLAPSLNILALPFLKWAFAQSKLRSPSRALLGVMRILLQKDVISLDEHLGSVPEYLDPTPKRFSMDEDLIHATGSGVTMEDFLVNFLIVFSKWVPHSVIDDTFHVLKAFISLTARSLTPKIVKIILKALLDRYTVRSKSYMKTIRYFVNVLTIGKGGFGGTGDYDDEIPSISDLIQMEKQRLADVETQQQDANNDDSNANEGDKKNEDIFTNVDSEAKCFAFVIDFCIAMPSKIGSAPSSPTSSSTANKQSSSSGMSSSTPASIGTNDFRSSLLQGDETEERLSFLFLCLLALRERSSKERHVRCVRCLWQALPNISTYCTTLLDHPRAEVQHLAFHIMDLLSASLVRDSPGIYYRMHLSHFLFLFLLNALKTEANKARPAALRLRCVFFVRSFLYRYMPFTENDVVDSTKNSNDGSTTLNLLKALKEELFSNDDFDTKSFGTLPKKYNDRRFAYAVLLWERITVAVNSPWKNLRSVALWVLGETTEVVVGSIENTDDQDDNIAWYSSRFGDSMNDSLTKLLNDDWECRLTVVKMLGSLINHNNTSIVQDAKIRKMLYLTSRDWHMDVKSAASGLISTIASNNDVIDGNNEEVETNENEGGNNKIRLGASPAAHFKGLWEDHEQAFAEQLESLEDFVRGDGKTKWGNVLPPPFLSNRLFESSVEVVPAPPEQAFLDSFLAKTDGQFSENEDELVEIDGDIVDDDDVPDDVELVTVAGNNNIVAPLEESIVDNNRSLMLDSNGVVIRTQQDGPPSNVESSEEDNEREVEEEDIEDDDEDDIRVDDDHLRSRNVEEEELLEEEEEDERGVMIENDEDRDGDISGEDYYYSEDSHYHQQVVYEGEGGVVIVNGEGVENGGRKPFPPKSQRPRSAPAKAKRLTKQQAHNGNVVVEQSSVDGFVFDDDSTASDDLFGESDEDLIPVLKQHVYKQRESLKPKKQQRPTASSRRQRQYYTRRSNILDVGTSVDHDNNNDYFVDKYYDEEQIEGGHYYDQHPHGDEHFEDEIVVDDGDNNYYSEQQQQQQQQQHQQQQPFQMQEVPDQEQRQLFHRRKDGDIIDGDFIEVEQRYFNLARNNKFTPPSPPRRSNNNSIGMIQNQQGLVIETEDNVINNNSNVVDPSRNTRNANLIVNSATRPRVSAKELREMLKEAW